MFLSETSPSLPYTEISISSLHLYLAYFPSSYTLITLKRHLLAWIICRQEQNWAENSIPLRANTCP